MAVNTDLVEIVSDDVRILKDIVEYNWLVGCTPTAVAMVIGYWDRNGYDNLIFGDSGTYSPAVQHAIATPEHYASYYDIEEGFSGDSPDASELGGAHLNNSIADYLYTSRSDLGLGNGWTFYGFEGIGVHGYAAQQGYDNFSTTHLDWGRFSFADVAREIDAGRPVILSVDSNADGRNDHNVTVFGYDAAAQTLLIHDGWERTEDSRWIEFTRAAEGQDFGITAATWVRPGENFAGEGEIQFMSFVNDFSGSASVYRSTLDSDGVFDAVIEETNSNLSRARSVAMASYDGHTVYRLYDDGSGSAALYEVVAYGDGTFEFVKRSSDSGLSRNTLDFATADGKLFYQLLDDGAGTAALYLSTLEDDGTFSWELLNADSGVSRNAIGFSTTDGEVFTVLVDDANGSAASYTAQLLSNGTFALDFLSANSGLSNNTLGIVEWANQTPEIPSYRFDGTSGDDRLGGTAFDDVIDGKGGSDVIDGSVGNDVIRGGGGEYDQVDYSGSSSDYQMTRNADGSVTVLKPGGGTDTLYDIDGFWFGGEGAWYSLDSLLSGAEITGTEGDDRLTGTGGDDSFNGLGGVDVISGSGGNDVIRGGGEEYDQVDYSGAASDYQMTRNGDGSVTVIKPGGGIDTLYDIDGFWFGGEGAWYGVDSLLSGAEITGTEGDDRLTGTGGDDSFDGLGGVDVISGSGGNDVIRGGGEEYDQVDYSGAASDYQMTRNGDGSVTVIKPGGGIDTLYDIDGFWFGGEGAWYGVDQLAVSSAPIEGTEAGDYLTGSSGDDVFFGFGGGDTFAGSSGNDTFYGGGPEIDQIDYSGAREDYVIYRNGDGSWTVEKPGGGEDTLFDIDAFWFNGSQEWVQIDDFELSA